MNKIATIDFIDALIIYNEKNWKFFSKNIELSMELHFHDINNGCTQYTKLLKESNNLREKYKNDIINEFCKNSNESKKKCKKFYCNVVNNLCKDNIKAFYQDILKEVIKIYIKSQFIARNNIAIDFNDLPDLINETRLPFGVSDIANNTLFSYNMVNILKYNFHNYEIINEYFEKCKDYIFDDEYDFFKTLNIINFEKNSRYNYNNNKYWTYEQIIDFLKKIKKSIKENIKNENPMPNIGYITFIYNFHKIWKPNLKDSQYQNIFNIISDILVITYKYSLKGDYNSVDTKVIKAETLFINPYSTLNENILKKVKIMFKSNKSKNNNEKFKLDYSHILKSNYFTKKSLLNFLKELEDLIEYEKTSYNTIRSMINDNPRISNELKDTVNMYFDFSE